ncbi:hypothetical protein CRG98_023042 [Punica granatum]|uniref:Uncharacterized protein n=1 Tax=Punica granatum TaxID=22663 RepID=A0A2I0JKV0_PUNGR|nr:hypothetical protein CRG98_023042 [Punica granatum]
MAEDCNSTYSRKGDASDAPDRDTRQEQLPRLEAKELGVEKRSSTGGKDKVLDEGSKLNFIFEKVPDIVTMHMRPLFISIHMFDIPIPRVLVDNGATVNVMPTSTMAKLCVIGVDLATTGNRAHWPLTLSRLKRAIMTKIWV